MKTRLFFQSAILCLAVFSSCQSEVETDPNGLLNMDNKAASVNTLSYDNFYDDMDWTFTTSPYCPLPPGSWTLCSTSSNGRWGRLSWNWSACPLDPSLVSIADGNLMMEVPGQWKGGQVNSLRNDYSYGSYRAKIKAGPHSGTTMEGTCSAFFFYNSATAQEIDVEILNREVNKVHFVTHPGDNQIIYSLPYDPASGYIEYGFDWYKNKVDFFVNSTKIGTQTRGVPNQRGTIMLNHWTGNPGWSGTFPPSPSVMYVDYVWHAPFLLVTRPDASGITWNRGSAYDITWNSYGEMTSGKVDIEIWKSGKLYKTIASRINNTGIYRFSVPSLYPAANSYRIKIKSSTTSDYYDYSNADFIIQ
jgi:hypothetical protein